jgi:hypothetical protein
MDSKTKSKEISFSYIIEEAKKLSPGSSDFQALHFYHNHLYAVSRYATDRQRRIDAAEKSVKAAELFEIFYSRRN